MFLQSCYIRKNNEGLRRSLENMGILHNSLDKNEYPWLASNHGLYLSIMSEHRSFCWKIWNPNDIDCGTNEDMFLALAALNDETDQYQWFVIDGKWHFCNYDLIEEYLHEEWGEFDYSELHKATADEIVEHFKNVGYVDC